MDILRKIYETKQIVEEQSVLLHTPLIKPLAPTLSSIKSPPLPDPVLSQFTTGLSFPDFIIPTYTSPEGLTDIAPNTFLEPYFSYLLIGPPGSGKSTLLMNLVKNTDLYGGKFTDILIISPDAIKGLELYQTPMNSNRKLDITWIKHKINLLNSKLRLPTSPRVNLLIVFDDVISQIKKLIDRDPFITELICNRRHLLQKTQGVISLLFTTQKYLNLVPTTLRNNITGMMIFKPSIMDLKSINSEFWGFPFAKFLNIIKLIFTSPTLNKKYPELLFLFWKRIDNSFFVNFNKLNLSNFTFL